jgi:hypothetical protein
LFVMLPGTAANPRTYREIIRVGAANGYHVIGLDYPNDSAVESTCRADPDPECAGRFRHEVITGQDASPQVTVDEANSIINRLTALLRWLSTTAPGEGWGHYLVANAVDWSKVSVGGHSQGGGHSAYLGKLFRLNRVVMFSAPGDTTGGAGVPSPWMALPATTPANLHFGFTHLDDPLIPAATATAAWTRLEGGPVTPASVDGTAFPFGSARHLTTRLPPNPQPTGPTAAPAHGAPVADAVTPRHPDGSPIYRDVWRWLAFPGGAAP